jgi:hypothetical protein
MRSNWRAAKEIAVAISADAGARFNHARSSLEGSDSKNVIEEFGILRTAAL